MFGLPLAFTVPFALAALAGLPVLYILLRVTPPRPQRVPFPPLKLILDLKPKDETPANTPWWLLLLRLALAALLIVAMAGPIWNPVSAGTKGDGPLLMIVDDSWAAASTWDRRILVATQRIEAAERQSRTIALATPSSGGRVIVPVGANVAIERLQALRPVPFTPDRKPLAGAVADFVKAHANTTIVWLSDGIEKGGGRQFAETLANLRRDSILVGDSAPIRALTDPRNDGAALHVRLLRSAPGPDDRGRVRALDLKGLTIGEVPFAFAQSTEVDAAFNLPIELRNEIARLEIVSGHSAGTVSLLDSRWKRRSVGIVNGDTADTDQPLLSASYYLAKALGPFADVHQPKPGAPNPIGAMLDDNVSVLVLADIGTVNGPIYDRLSKFVEDGGMLVRFAGTRLSGATDDLVPVKLRRGGRVLGGSLSWERPKILAAFEPPSPFVGIKVPSEVTVTRQVLAEPEPGVTGKTWAQLSDGTPLVTAASRGKGTVVLFHITADTTWSNLPISGLFIEMLKKIVALSGEHRKAADGGVADAVVSQPNRAVQTVAPLRTLDGFGALGPPPPTAKPVPTDFGGTASAEHPPGFYGTPDSLLSINALAPTDRIPAIDLAGLDFERASLRAAEPMDLRPWLLVAAFCLFLFDSLASLWLSGKLKGVPRRTAMASFVVLFAVLASVPNGTPVRAATPAPAPAPIAVAPSDLASALTTRLAYVISGDAKVDEVSRQGLTSLSTTLANRTSLTPGEPIGIDPTKDELAFYPLLYWPIVATNPQPSQQAIDRIGAYMRQGGTIIFDTRDALSIRPSGEATPETAWLRELLKDVDVPELEPVPVDHVVTKTFYLLDNFIGRYASGQTWIEALPPAVGDPASHPARSGDGVSPIILTANDLAGGWAADEFGDALYPLVPGDPRQHELALRGGINLVMYTLTGNYKADQVHVRDLLERLGH